LVEKCSFAEKNVSIRVVVFEKRLRTFLSGRQAGPKPWEVQERSTQRQRCVSSLYTRCTSQGLGPAPVGIHATFWLTAVRHSQRVRLHDPFDWPFRRAPVQNVHNGTYRRIESVTAGALTLKVRYNNEEVVLVVIPKNGCVKCYSHGFYTPVSLLCRL